MKKKKVLFYAQSLGSGGAERQMVTLASLLKDQGYDISFFCAKYGTLFYKDYLSEKNIPVQYSTKFRGKTKGKIYAVLHQIACVFEFAKHIRKHKIDCVISFLPSCNYIACVTRFLVKYRLITGERSSKPETFLGAKGRFQGFFQKKADVIVCNSYNAQELWMKYFPKYKNKLITIYNIVSIFQNDYEIINADQDKVKILVLASYQENKNPTRIIKAVSLLTEAERSKLRIDWWGAYDFAGSNYKECVNLINDLLVSDTVYLHGVTKKVGEEIVKCDVVALVSNVEGLPNAICEGMMMGKAILMTKVSDYNVLVDNSNGFLCDSTDEVSIADALKRVLKTTRLELNEMGRISKRKAEKLFSKDLILEKWRIVIR